MPKPLGNTHNVGLIRLSTSPQTPKANVSVDLFTLGTAVLVKEASGSQAHHAQWPTMDVILSEYTE